MDVVLISYLVAVAVSFAVGLPTVQRALRRRDVPLVLLGMAVTLDGVEWLAWTLASYTPAAGAPLGYALSITCRLGIIASVLCLILFTRLVFRPRSRPAAAFALLLGALLLISFAGSGAVGDWEGVRNDHVFIWLEQLALIIGYAWTSVEAGREYWRGRRRARFGLGDRLAAHRMLLWAIYAGLFFLAQGVYVVTLAYYEMLSRLDALNACITVLAELALGAAVFAPAWYVRLVAPPSEAEPRVPGAGR